MSLIRAGPSRALWVKALPNEPLPQAWLQGGALVTHFQARDIELFGRFALSGLTGSLLVWPVPQDQFALGVCLTLFGEGTGLMYSC